MDTSTAINSTLNKDRLILPLQQIRGLVSYSLINPTTNKGINTLIFLESILS